MGTQAERIAAEVIRQLEAGTAPWVVPWVPGEGSPPPSPHNAVTGKRYRGVNRFVLSMAHPGTSEDSRWCTYRQAQSVGAQVRKGSRGQPVVFPVFRIKKPVLEGGRPKIGSDGKAIHEIIELERPRLRYAVVFHASQVEGLPELERAPAAPQEAWERHAEAERLLSASGAVILHDQRDQAFYRPGTDTIHLPKKGQFATADRYYATALHELGHWTGHESRLNRDMGPKGTPGYAEEELRAEMASYLLGTELGIGHDPGQHIAYIGEWVELVKADRFVIHRAATAAETICDYIQGRMQEQEQTQQRTEDRDMSKQQPAERDTRLYVPYEQRVAAREAGARWNKKEKFWYAPKGADLAPLQRWATAPPQALEAPVDAKREFEDFCRGLGLQPDGVIYDGQLHRCAVEGGKKGARDGAYVAHFDGHPAGWAQNHKTGEEAKWKATGQELTDAQRMSLRASAEKARQERNETQEAGYREVSRRLTKQWEEEKPWLSGAAAERHLYLTNKGLGSPGDYGLRVDQQKRLVVPLRDAEGVLWSLQKIGEAGFKCFEKGGRTRGTFHTIGEAAHEQQGAIYVTTGVATGAAIHQATGKTVVCAMNDGNLSRVAEQLQALHPKIPMVIWGDDDRAQEAKGNKNSGRESAQEAAKRTGGAAVLPKFQRGDDPKFSDFADLLVARGPQALRVEESKVRRKLGLGKNRTDNLDRVVDTMGRKMGVGR